MNTRAFGNDLFVHRRLIEIRRDTQRHDPTPELIARGLAELSSVEAMMGDAQAIAAYEAEHGRSSSLIYRWGAARIDWSYNAPLAIAALREELRAEINM